MMFGKKKQEEFKKVEVEEEVPEEDPIKEITEDVKKKLNKKEKVDEEKKEIFEVVKELPMQPVRQVKDEDGTLITYITIEEALTKVLNEK